MKGIKLAVSGSRYMVTGIRLGRVLHDLRPKLVLVGDARGCDELTVEWCINNKVMYHQFLASWESYGSSAGPIRNQQILDDGKPDFWVAFPFEQSRGTRDFINRARKMSIPGVVIDNGDATPMFM